MKSKIGIPKPCSEDWNMMTPTQKGAFCSKCQIDVIDFTGKEPEDIREILVENTGKRTCGHISKVQMDLVNTDYHLWNNQSVTIFKSKFLYACVVVFGMGLFSSCGQVENHEEVGEIEIEGALGNDNTTCLSGDTILWNDSDVLIDGMIDQELGEIEPME